MPAKSASQFRLMQACAHDKDACPPGLSQKEAKEFVKGQSPKGLPERKSAKKPKK